MSSAINWSALAFILAALGLVVFMLVVPRLLGGRSQGVEKNEVFESGVVGAGNARIRLSAKFYLVAIFFVIFDLEALYLYAYAVSVKEAGWIGYATVVIFVVDLLIGLVYALSLGAINWAPADKRRKKPRLDKAPLGFSLASITKFDGIENLHTDPTGKVPAQSSGQVNVSNDIKTNKLHLSNIDHINHSGHITSIDFNQFSSNGTSGAHDASTSSNSSLTNSHAQVAISKVSDTAEPKTQSTQNKPTSVNTSL